MQVQQILGREQNRHGGAAAQRPGRHQFDDIERAVLHVDRHWCRANVRADSRDHAPGHGQVFEDRLARWHMAEALARIREEIVELIRVRSAHESNHPRRIEGNTTESKHIRRQLRQTASKGVAGDGNHRSRCSILVANC